MTFYSPYQFAAFRILLGATLSGYFLCLLPYASELFGADSFFVRPEAGARLFRQIFPSLLDEWSAHASVFVGVLALAGASFAAGVARRPAALVLWYGLTCLVNRNPGILNPSHPFLGWLCLASCLVPGGEPWAAGGARRESWTMPRTLFRGAWLVLALSYSASGIAKLGSPEWIDGTAMTYVLGMPYARDLWLRDVLSSAPDLAIRLLTWGVLLTELLFAPLCLWHRSRMLVWWAAVIFHLGLLVLFDFWELTAGMLLFHLFTFDARSAPRFVRLQPAGAAAPGR